MNHVYLIDKEELTVSLDDNSNYKAGSSEILTERFGDLISDKNWFKEGFSTEKSSNFYDEKKLYSSTEDAVKKIISNLDPGLQLDGFTLEKYHRYVSEKLHSEVIKKTKRLFPEDLSIDTNQIVKRFSEYFNTKLSFTNPVSHYTQWMIARINRPRSNDYNTVHKDIYEIFDKYPVIPKMVNIWIPLCGVTELNSLPIVPRSHLLSEDMIIRSRAGSIVNGIPYSVASIKSWNESTSLDRVLIKSDELLVFSSHLIHGLAYNASNDVTRISFEFRLYEEL